jgi:WD40 repeat protein
VEPDTGDLIQNISGPTDAKSIRHNSAFVFAASADGSLVAMSNNTNLGHVWVFQTTNWTITKTVDVKGAAFALSFAPSGRLAVGETGGLVEVVNLETSTIEQSISAYLDHRSVGSVSFSPDGDFLAVAPTVGLIHQKLDAGPVRVWQTETWQQLASLGSVSDDQTFSQVAWSPEGKLLSATSFSGAFYVWQFGPHPVPVYQTHIAGGGFSTKFSRDGMLAITENAEVVILR